MNSQTTRLLAWSVALVASPRVVVAGLVGYAFLKPTAAASGPVQASAVRAATAGTTIYEIDQTASTASYMIDEMLRGAPVTVVGETN